MHACTQQNSSPTSLRFEAFSGDERKKRAYRGDAPASPAPETRLLATRNVRLMTENEVLHYRSCRESAGRDREDGTNELKRASDTTAAHSENLDFWER